PMCGDRSHMVVLFTARTGAWLLAAFVMSVAVAQVAVPPAMQLTVPARLVKWPPLLAPPRISLLPPVRGTSWVVVQFFRNAPWLVLLFFVMYLLPFEFHVGGMTIPFPDWIKATIGLALPIMANMAEIVRGAGQSIPTGHWEAGRRVAC